MEEKVMILQRQSRLPAKRREETPFVICFSEYPTVCGLDYPYLVGAEIAFNPSPLASMTHDLVESFRQFNIAEQRKGK